MDDIVGLGALVNYAPCRSDVVQHSGRGTESAGNDAFRDASGA